MVPGCPRYAFQGPTVGAILTRMLSVVTSFWVHGVEGQLVRVEVSVRTGLPIFTVVGLPAGAVREGKERVFAALAQSGMALPPRRVTVNLAPADLPKSGSGLDLPVAVALLAALGHVPAAAVERCGFVGELGLDASIRPVRGAIALAMCCRAHGGGRLYVPWDNAAEAAAVPGVEVVGIRTVEEVVGLLRGEIDPAPPPTPPTVRAAGNGRDLGDIRGQELAKRALLIAAAGGHSLLMSGPPGAGKTMLAARLAGILPPLAEAESLEVTRVHSVAGLTSREEPVKFERPFRAPHHTISAGGLVGGGNPPRPGEISLAHLGVLFLDELAEFKRSVLDTLRQPMESGRVSVSRVGHTVNFPARFQFVGAMNPCPCGQGGDDCTCSDRDIARYRSRISGPLLDRIDLQLAIGQVGWGDLNSPGRPDGLDSAAAQKRVVRARRRQRQRFGTDDGVNALMPARRVISDCTLTETGEKLLESAVATYGLSARAVHRTLRVALTIADLEDRSGLGEQEIAEALRLRVGVPTLRAATRAHLSAGAAVHDPATAPLFPATPTH